jgi:hypothetical protein
MASGTKKLIPEESQIPLEELSENDYCYCPLLIVFRNSSYLLW